MSDNADLDLTEFDPDPEGPSPTVLERGAVLEDELQPVSGVVTFDVIASVRNSDDAVAVSLALSDDENDALEDIAARRGTSADAVVREGLAAMRLLDVARDDGVRMYVQSDNGSVRELVHR